MEGDADCTSSVEFSADNSQEMDWKEQRETFSSFLLLAWLPKVSFSGQEKKQSSPRRTWLRHLNGQNKLNTSPFSYSSIIFGLYNHSDCRLVLVKNQTFPQGHCFMSVMCLCRLPGAPREMESALGEWEGAAEHRARLQSPEPTDSHQTE